MAIAIFLTLMMMPGAAVACSGPKPPATVLYDQKYHDGYLFPELVLDAVMHQFTGKGLVITGKEGLVRLNKYYALAERTAQYHVRFSKDAKAVFQSDKGDFKAYVDVRSRKISIATTPLTERDVPFLDSRHDYRVEIGRNYQVSSIKITDLSTGESTAIAATMDGAGGVGRGSVGTGFFVGRQYDYYCFGLVEGTSMTVRRLCVKSKKSNLRLLIYGDSITEPEGYFPTKLFPQSWTQLVMEHIKGPCMTSGRGGTTIKELTERIRNELPYIKAKYVMVTIGTNGGNTEDNLGELVEYILANGSVPILNNIPSNESGTQVAINAMIEKVRQRYKINGCRFDLATSVNGDGKIVDTTMMWFEDYDWGKIYHHPNAKGALQMYNRTLMDVPEIYE
ncbi:MAG: SGNH/GDSL hydrolase family protein [Sphingobacteriales bacterium]|nr:SGNH/GDSL hydrolase family protein [Sphingobacteriales bacterium]